MDKFHSTLLYRLHNQQKEYPSPKGKYLKEVLNKFGMEECALLNTEMVTIFKLCKYDESLKVALTMYLSIIGNLFYLKTLRPDIMKFVGVVGRYQ